MPQPITGRKVFADEEAIETLRVTDIHRLISPPEGIR